MDEVCALHLYTQESPFYKLLNARLRDRNRQLLKPFFPLLKIMINALQKLPPIDKTVYRGVKKNLLSKYKEKIGKKEIWWSFSSTTVSISVLQNELFLGKEGDRSMFIISGVSLRDISRYSAIPGEQELLLLPGTVFIVDSVLDSNLAVVQLKEHDSLLCTSTALPLRQTIEPVVVVDPQEKPKSQVVHLYKGKYENKDGKYEKDKDGKHEHKHGKYENNKDGKYENDKDGKYEHKHGKYEKDKDEKYEKDKDGKYEKDKDGKYEKPKYSHQNDDDRKKHYHHSSSEKGKNEKDDKGLPPKKTDKINPYEKVLSPKKPGSSNPKIIKNKNYDL